MLRLPSAGALHQGRMRTVAGRSAEIRQQSAALSGQLTRVAKVSQPLPTIVSVPLRTELRRAPELPGSRLQIVSRQTPPGDGESSPSLSLIRLRPAESRPYWRCWAQI